VTAWDEGERLAAGSVGPHRGWGPCPLPWGPGLAGRGCRALGSRQCRSCDPGPLISSPSSTVAASSGERAGADGGSSASPGTRRGPAPHAGVGTRGDAHGHQHVSGCPRSYTRGWMPMAIDTWVGAHACARVVGAHEHAGARPWTSTGGCVDKNVPWVCVHGHRHVRGCPCTSRGA